MIETDRLILRPWLDSDAEALFRYASDPDVGPRAGWPPHKDIEESKRVIRDIFTNDRTWAVTLRETGEAIGCMGYYIHGESNIPIGEEDAEIGYWIAKPYWNRGIATEALRAMIDYCFNVKGFLTLWSDFFIDNPASGRVMEKCGFKDTGELNWCSNLYHGDDRPVHIMKSEPILNSHNKAEYEPAHTAEHILNRTMMNMFGCPRSRNAHIERKKSKCDHLLAECPTDDQVKAIEAKVNEVIAASLPVTVEYMSREKAASIVDLSKLPEDASETLRIVRVGDYDDCACIGAHVGNTSEIGEFRIISHDFNDGIWRVRWKVNAKQ